MLMSEDYSCPYCGMDIEADERRAHEDECQYAVIHGD